MKLTPLFSGSSGNSILIESNDVKVLVDAGFNCKRIQTELTSLGINLEDISAVFITHEHTDHVSALGVLSRKFHIPVYCNELTYEALKKQRDYPSEDCVHIFKTGSPVDIKGSLNVTSFNISHDATEPVGYVFDNGNTKMGIATDTGILTDEIMNNLSSCKGILFESNHDVAMLREGSYPAFLKQRILSDKGHLSNETASKALCNLISSGVEKIMLAHLSKENNTPLIALNTAVKTLSDMKFVRDIDYSLNVARRDSVSDPIEV